MFEPGQGGALSASQILRRGRLVGGRDGHLRCLPSALAALARPRSLCSFRWKSSEPLPSGECADQTC